MKIDKLFNLKHYTGDLGLELEVESNRPDLPTIGNKDWSIKGEGSLRYHGIEYVSRPPIWNNSKKLIKIKHVTDRLKECKIIKDSPRTSVHVHINVQKYNTNQIYNVICAYGLLENLLTKFCGPTREGNHFCLRLCDAESIVQLLLEDLQIGKHFHSFFQAGENTRYSAINLAAIPKFGSIEFRAMRGTINPFLIDYWSSELHSLCTIAKEKFVNPAALMDYYFTTEKLQFLSTFFSRKFVTTLTSIPYWKDLITENEGLLCGLGYASDWKKPTRQRKTKKSNSKRKTRRLVEEPIGNFRVIIDEPQALAININLPDQMLRQLTEQTHPRIIDPVRIIQENIANYRNTNQASG